MHFDAVLTDLNMPLVDGYELTRILRKGYDRPGYSGSRTTQASRRAAARAPAWPACWSLLLLTILRQTLQSAKNSGVEDACA